MHTLRTRFKKEIVAEFLPPSRKWKQINLVKKFADDRAKVVILATGMPSVPSKGSLVEYWSRKGFWVFYPRYRGSWESGGEFLKKSPTLDIKDVLNQLEKGFTSIWDKKSFKLKFKQVTLIGGSFGGPAALLLSKDKRVDKVVAVSPVVDWTAPSKSEPLAEFYYFVKDAFGEAFRLNKKNWNKLISGKFYNPVNQINQIDGQKVLIFHAQDDDVVNYKSVVKFAKLTGAKLYLSKKGGHLGASILMKPNFEKKVLKFIRS